MFQTPVGRLLPLCLLALLSGCQTVTAPPAAPIAPQPLPPVATHSFAFDPDHDSVVGEVQVTEAREEDTLSDIARRFNIGYEEIVRANPDVDPWLPRAGTRIVLPTQFVLPDGPRTGIVINLAALRMYYFPPRAKGELQTVVTHPIGIGRVGWITPLGATKVTGKRENPAWYPPASVRKEHAAEGDPLPAKVAPGPDNPLGKYAMNLGWPSYLIHGTNQPYGVGIRASHGCIRMYPEDIAALYDDIPVGTKVTVVNQPMLYGRRGEQIYLQSFPIFDDYPKPKQVVSAGNLRAKKGAAEKGQRMAAASTAKVAAATAKATGKNTSATATAVSSVPGAAKVSPKSAVQKAEESDAIHENAELVTELAQNPRGIAVPVSHRPMSVDSYVANARTVENRVPDRATWDGVD
jgi:L,D-transpeptidase ErfK/SrfK